MRLRVCQRMTTTERVVLYVYNIYIFHVDLKVLKGKGMQCLRQEEKDVVNHYVYVSP